MPRLADLQTDHLVFAEQLSCLHQQLFRSEISVPLTRPAHASTGHRRACSAAFGCSRRRNVPVRPRCPRSPLRRRPQHAKRLDRHGAALRRRCRRPASRQPKHYPLPLLRLPTARVRLSHPPKSARSSITSSPKRISSALDTPSKRM